MYREQQSHGPIFKFRRHLASHPLALRGDTVN
jgi:hypothetical protein